MPFETLVFYAFATVLVGAALGVITAKNPVHAALFLVLAFFTSAGLWLLLEAEFLAISLVLVYVGAVMVLFLFVVMMLDINVTPLREGMTRYAWPGGLMAVAIVAEIGLLVGTRYFGLDRYPAPARHGAEFSNTEELGRVLYTEYLYPFEIAAAILLVAIVAAIALTLRRRPGSKYQDPATQVRVHKSERLRIMKMPAEQVPVKRPAA